MTKVHPEFDVKTQTWFWNEFEAPSLRELKHLLGKGVKIVDYYPTGLSASIKIARAKNDAKMRCITPAMVNIASGFSRRGY